MNLDEGSLTQMIWTKIVTLPYSPYLSKNRSTKVTKRGIFYKDPRHKNSQEEIMWRLKKEKLFLPKEEKIYLNIYLFKPRLNMDAINIIDGLADSIAKAMDLNDKYFSIFRLDWEVDKANPRIFLNMGYVDKNIRKEAA